MRTPKPKAPKPSDDPLVKVFRELKVYMRQCWQGEQELVPSTDGNADEGITS